MISLRKGCSAFLAAAVLLTSACENSEESTAPFVASKLSVVGNNTAEAPAGLPIATPFTVRLTTKDDQPVGGRWVKFTVSSGATLSTDSTLTDANGLASVGVTVGAVGAYTVTATVAGVAPVTFTATAVAPVPTLLLASEATNNQAGLANEAVQPLQAVVLNSDGSPAAGVTVNFVVTAGGGSVSPTSAVTNASGIATTTFTIGSTGTQSVTVTSAGLPAATFTASVADPCNAARTLAVPATLSRSLDAADCKRPDNRFIEYFTVNSTAFQVLQTSSTFVPSLILTGATKTDTLAFHGPASTTPLPATASFKVFAPTGALTIGATSQGTNVTGAYTLTSVSTAGQNITNCEARVFLVPGVSIDQSISATDCVFTADATQKSDRFRLYLKPGQIVKIELSSIPQTSGNIDMWLRIINPAGTTVISDTDCCGSATIETTTLTATAAGAYFVEAGVFFDATAPSPTTGNYRLKITQM